MTDSLENSPVSPIEFFRVKSGEAGSEQSRINMSQAVDALEKYVGGSDISFASFTEAMVGEWVSRLLFRGYSPKTVSNNILKRLATLYNKAVSAGLAEPTGVFRTFQNALSSESAESVSSAIDSGVFGKLQKVIRTDCSGSPGRQLAKDVVLFAVYTGGMDFDDIARFRKDGYAGDSAAILEIVERHSMPRNRYLFPLGQGRSTAGQVRRRVESLFREALTPAGLHLSADAPRTAADLWAQAALGCGISASDVAACIAPENRDTAAVTYAVPSQLSAEEIARIRSRVESALTRNPVRWYAMHLRRRVDYTGLTGRLEEQGIRLAEMYYPMEEIARKVGRRKIFESRPVISWLVFFRARVSELDPLYQRIGDLAWGYRQTRDLGSPYAAVSDAEVARYREAIGVLGPDTEILPDSAVGLTDGDCVVLLGGPMNGLHGKFVTERRQRGGASGGRTVYRIRLAGGVNANWTVDRDPRLVRKITEEQYKELDRQFRERVLEEHNERII